MTVNDFVYEDVEREYVDSIESGVSSLLKGTY